MTKLLKSAPIHFLCKRPCTKVTIQRGKAGLSSSRFSKSLCLGAAAEDVAERRALSTWIQGTSEPMQMFSSTLSNMFCSFEQIMSNNFDLCSGEIYPVLHIWPYSFPISSALLPNILFQVVYGEELSSNHLNSHIAFMSLNCIYRKAVSENSQ